MFVDDTGMRPSPSKLVAIATMPETTDVEKLHPFPGISRYLRNSVPRCSMIAAPLRKLLCNKAFASKRARKLAIEWGYSRQVVFRALKNTLSTLAIFVFPSWSHPFTF